MNVGIHIVLFQPEIPANTGNIARTCLATDATLHLIHPLGFSIDSKAVKRAGLDYWHNVRVQEYDDLAELYKRYEEGTFYYIENFGTKSYTDVNFQQEEAREIFLIFGRETSGIPREEIVGKEESCLQIPSSDNVRSLNLSNSVAIVVFEVLRQQGFPNAK